MLENCIATVDDMKQEVYVKLLNKAKGIGTIRVFKISKELSAGARAFDLIKENKGKIMIPATVITSAILLLCAKDVPIFNYDPIEDTVEQRDVVATMRTAALTDFDNLITISDTTNFAKISNRLLTKYKIEKGLSIYNDRLTPSQLSELSAAIMKASDTFNLPPDLVTGIVITETRGKPNQRSYAGAYGPMQVMYSIHGKTLTKFGVNKAEDLYNPEKGIMSGAWILKGYLERSNYNVKRALAKYYGANSPAYYNGTIKRASVVRNAKVSTDILNNSILEQLNLNDEQIDLFYRMVYASTLGNGLTLKKAAAWLTVDSPSMSETDTAKVLALLKHFGKGENGNVLDFPENMKATALNKMTEYGERLYLEEITNNLLQAHAIATNKNINHGLFIACAQRAQSKIKTLADKENSLSVKAINKEEYYYSL